MLEVIARCRWFLSATAAAQCASQAVAAGQDDNGATMQHRRPAPQSRRHTPPPSAAPSRRPELGQVQQQGMHGCTRYAGRQRFIASTNNKCKLGWLVCISNAATRSNSRRYVTFFAPGTPAARTAPASAVPGYNLAFPWRCDGILGSASVVRVCVQRRRKSGGRSKEQKDGPCQYASVWAGCSKRAEMHQVLDQCRVPRAGQGARPHDQGH